MSFTSQGHRAASFLRVLVTRPQEAGWLGQVQGHRSVKGRTRLRLREKNVFLECTKIIFPGVSLFKLPSADFSTPKCHFSRSLFLLASMVMRGRSCYMAFSCWNLILEEGNGFGLWVKLKNVVKAFDYNNSKPFSRRFSGTVL